MLNEWDWRSERFTFRYRELFITGDAATISHLYQIENRGHFLVDFWSAWSFIVKLGHFSLPRSILTLIAPNATMFDAVRNGDYNNDYGQGNIVRCHQGKTNYTSH